MSEYCLLTIDKQKIKTYSYFEYMSLMESYAELGATSGNDQSEDKIKFTKLNFVRMKRLNKTIKLDSKFTTDVCNLSRPQCWTVITEAWCGDGAQNIPALAKIAEMSEGKINFQLVFRDDNIQFMNQYLTNGGQAIPKLISRNNFGSDLFYWGPRPEKASAIMRDWKMDPCGRSKREIEITLQQWYLENNQQDLMKEMSSLLLSC